MATALGEVAREVRSENELWMAMALTGPAAQGLPPGALAAFVSCLTAGDVLGTKPGVRCSYAPTEQASGRVGCVLLQRCDIIDSSSCLPSQVVLAAEALEMSRVALEDAQSEAGIAGPGSTVAIDARLAGLVEVRVIAFAVISGVCGFGCSRANVVTPPSPLTHRPCPPPTPPPRPGQPARRGSRSPRTRRWTTGTSRGCSLAWWMCLGRWLTAGTSTPTCAPLPGPRSRPWCGSPSRTSSEFGNNRF